MPKISALTDATGVAGADELVIVQSGTTKRVTAAEVFAAPPAIGGTTPAAGDFTTLSATGLVDLSAAGAGQIKFPATQNASADANTLDDYEEGTWTPTDNSGAGLAIAVSNPTYTKIGRLVLVRASTIIYPVTADATAASIGGFPFTNSAGDVASGALVSTNTFASRALVLGGGTIIFFYADGAITASTNAQLSGATIYGFSAVYSV